MNSIEVYKVLINIGTSWIYPISKFETHSLSPRVRSSSDPENTTSADENSTESSNSFPPKSNAVFCNLLFLIILIILYILQVIFWVIPYMCELHEA